MLAAAAARARSYFCYFNLNLPRSCVRAVLAWVAVCARHRPSSKKKKKKKNFHSFSPVYFSFNPLHRREREFLGSNSSARDVRPKGRRTDHSPSSSPHQVSMAQLDVFAS